MKQLLTEGSPKLHQDRQQKKNAIQFPFSTSSFRSLVHTTGLFVLRAARKSGAGG